MLRFNENNEVIREDEYRAILVGLARDEDISYSMEELKSFIPVIQSARNEGRTVQLYFNNHPKGTGFMNAMQIKGILGGT